MQDVDERAHEQAGAGEQHEGERDFGRDEGSSPGPPRTGRLAARFAQVAGEVDPADGQNRSQTKQGADAERDGEGEPEHASVERDMIEVHEGGRPRGKDGVNGGVSDGERREAAEHSEYQAFREELAGQAASGGAECSADGGFAQAAPGASHQQVGHIGAPDEKHETHATKQAKQGGPDFTNRIGLKGNDGDSEVAQRSASPQLVDLGGGGVHFRLSGGERGSVAETADDVQETRAVRLPRSDRNGLEDLDVGRNARIVGKDQAEISRENPDDRGTMAAKAHGAPDDG